MQITTYSKYLKYVILLLLIIIPIFGFLDNLSLRVWDESRNANNAYEMFKNGNYIVTYFNGLPEMWNTKPPLLIWCQVFFMKIIGVNILAIRLPVAFAAFLTCIAVFVFLKKYTKSFILGFAAVLVLVTSAGYISMHGSRSGDYDVMVTFFITCSSLLFFSFLEIKKNSFLYLFFAVTALAILTKSITGVLFIPAIIAYTFWSKNVLFVLKNKHFYYGLCMFLLIVLGYYFWREYLNPGYLNAIYENELGGRFNEAKENMTASKWYYIDNIKNFRFKAWYLFSALGIVLGCFSTNLKLKKLAVFLAFLIPIFLFIISMAKTKHNWYDMPLYPLLAIGAGIFLYLVFNLLDSFDEKLIELKPNILPIIFLFGVFYFPYQDILIFISKDEPPSYIKTHMSSYYLQDALDGKHDLNNVGVLYDGYDAHIKFYIHALKEKGVNVKKLDFKNLKEGDVVVAHQKSVLDYLEENYKLKGIEGYRDSKLYNSLKKVKIISIN